MRWIAVPVHARNRNRRIQIIVANELGSANQIDHQLVERSKAAGGPRLGSLHLHSFVKTIHIQGQIMLSCNVSSQINGKTESVIQLEHRLTRQYGPIEFFYRLFQNFHAMLEGSGKLLLFFPEHLLDEILTLDELRVSLTHSFDKGADQPMKKYVFEA